MTETRVQVFLGKGGVGKTTCSAATSLALAERGQSSLVISTDPTPSLSHIFEVEGEHREREVLPHLHLTELGLRDVRAMWDERFGRDVYGVFSSFVDIDYPTFVDFVTAVLPGLNEEFMVDYIRRLALESRYRHVVWDTAPLGQTLALLGMPQLLAEHLRAAPRIYSHLRTTGERREPVIEIIGRWRELADLCMQFLRREVAFSMVTIPEALSVLQLDDVVEELARYDLRIAEARPAAAAPRAAACTPSRRADRGDTAVPAGGAWRGAAASGGQAACGMSRSAPSDAAGAPVPASPRLLAA